MSCKNRNISKNVPQKIIELGKNSWYVTNQLGPGNFNSSNMDFKINFKNGVFNLELDPNSCSGSYKVLGNSITFGENISCTKTCCEKQDGKMLKGAIKGTYTVNLADSTLILKNETVTLELNKNPTPKRVNFNGKKYSILKVLNMGNEFKPAFKHEIDFNDKMMNIQLDANSCFSDYKISNDNIFFSNIGCTESCCDSKESEIIKSFFKGQLMYLFEDDVLVLFNKTGRIWMSPEISKTMPVSEPEASSLIGKRFKIYDIIKLPQGPEAVGAVSVKYEFEYLLGFSQNAFSLRLDVNNCNGTAAYEGNNIDFGSGMGCTKMCCDNKESNELKNKIKGIFNIQKEGSLLVLSNSLIKIRLEEVKQ